MEQVVHHYHDIVSLSHAIFFFCLLVALWVPAVVWFMYDGSWPIWFYDDVEHFLGGIFAFMLYAILFFRETISLKVFFFSCIGGSALFGALWEIWWYGFSFIVTGSPETYISLPDTITDISYDIGGGICAGIYYVAWLSESRISKEKIMLTGFAKT
ncbi:MAG: hypothetical protein G01um101470_834 [Parcubacteria group bacterium Gr01-1014_70]|nr:MAG: hypothetical protein G01um101470_834 [Parcubacteria group bacterium Gr01-1014_70]